MDTLELPQLLRLMFALRRKEETDYWKLRRWFKKLKHKLIRLCNDFNKNIPATSYFHAHAMYEYLEAIRMLREALLVCVEKSRGAYVDEDSVCVRRSNKEYKYGLIHRPNFLLDRPLENGADSSRDPVGSPSERRSPKTVSEETEGPSTADVGCQQNVGLQEQAEYIEVDSSPGNKS